MNMNKTAVFTTFARNLPTMFLSVISRAATGVAAAARWLGEIMYTSSKKPITGNEEQGTVSVVDSIDDIASQAPSVAKTGTYSSPSFMKKAIVGLASILAAAGIARASSITWGTDYLGTNPDGTHNWSTTVYNDSTDPTSDSAIYLVMLGTTLADGYGVGSSVSDWNLTGVTNDGDPFTDIFTMETGDSDYFVYPIGMGDPLNAQITFYYTTPSNIDHLGTTQNTFYTWAAGSSTGSGLMPVPEPTTGLLLLLGAATIGLSRHRKVVYDCSDKEQKKE